MGGTKIAIAKTRIWSGGTRGIFGNLKNGRGVRELQRKGTSQTEGGVRELGYEHYFGLGVRELGYEHDSERFGEGYENCREIRGTSPKSDISGTPKAAIRGEI